MPMLKQLTLKGWKSIRSASLDLKRINILIGANGAGKSNVVSFFKLLNEMIELRLQFYVQTSGGAESLLYLGAKRTSAVEAELVFVMDDTENRYFMELKPTVGDLLIFSEERFAWEADGSRSSRRVIDESGHRESVLKKHADKGQKTARTLHHLMTGCRVYHFHDTSNTARIWQPCYIEMNRHLAPDAANLAAMLYVYQQKEKAAYDRIVSTVRKIAPSVWDFVLEPQRLNPQKIVLNWRQRESDYLFGPHQLSDGTIRAIALATLFLQPEDDLPNLIVLDEPELGLHPQALEILAGLIRSVSQRSQVIVATQSAGFVDHFSADEIIVVDTEEESSRFRNLDPADLEDWLKDYSVGDLWQKNVIGGGPLA